MNTNAIVFYEAFSLNRAFRLETLHKGHLSMSGVAMKVTKGGPVFEQ